MKDHGFIRVGHWTLDQSSAVSYITFRFRLNSLNAVGHDTAAFQVSSRFSFERVDPSVVS